MVEQDDAADISGHLRCIAQPENVGESHGTEDTRRKNRRSGRVCAAERSVTITAEIIA